MYLGVDGGGTKTAFVLLDDDNKIVSQHLDGTCYYIEVGIEGAQKVLHNGIQAVFTKAGIPIQQLKYAFFGLPAYGEDSSMLETLNAMPGRLLPAQKYQCGNDMINGWAAAFGGGDGINIIAGTGSIAYGQRQGKSVRCGGWGELFSDEGSAYWIGRRGLELFTHMSDGRCEKGPLYDIIKQKLNIQQDLDICALVLSDWKGERGAIANVSTLVYQAAQQNDCAAKAIFNDAATQLAKIVEASRKQLGYVAGEPVNIAYSGGVFKAGELIMTPFKQAMAQFSDDYQIHQPQTTPDVGAALYARLLSAQ